MTDQRGRLLMAALGFAGCSMPSYDRALWALRTWLDSWPRHRPRGRGHAPSGLRPPVDPVRRTRLARDVRHDRHGALAHERDRHRVGAHAVARDAAGGVEGVEDGPRGWLDRGS